MIENSPISFLLVDANSMCFQNICYLYVFNSFSPAGTHVSHLETFLILEFLRILKKYSKKMSEANTDLYKIAWIMDCMNDNIETCTLRSFDPIDVLIWGVPEFTSTLLEWNETCSACVGLVPVSIAVGSKKLKTL